MPNVACVVLKLRGSLRGVRGDPIPELFAVLFPKILSQNSFIELFYISTKSDIIIIPDTDKDNKIIIIDISYKNYIYI